MACDFRTTQALMNSAVADAFTAPVGDQSSQVAFGGVAVAITGLTEGSMYRLWADANCHVRFTLGGTDAADAGDMPITAELSEWFVLTGVDRVSVLGMGGASGTLTVTKLGA